MQIKRAVENVFLRRISYFTTKRPSKKRKMGNVEWLFSKWREMAKKIVRFPKNMALFLLIPLLATVFFSNNEDNASTASERHPASQGDALSPMHRLCESDQNDSISVFFAVGDAGDTVLALENALSALGYDVGNIDGLYSSYTGAAIRRFQADRGLTVDGLCTEALCHTAISLAKGSRAREETVSKEVLADALYRMGCMREEDVTASMQNGQLLRDALILFQRSRGLCGVGQANYATLCALGLNGMFVYAQEGTADLSTYLIASYLARFSACYPEQADLHTLVCVAASLYNRALSYDEGSPWLSVVCSAPIKGEKGTVTVSPTPLCLRAAENALLRLANGDDPVRGATDFCHASYYAEYAKEGETVPKIVRRVGEIYFLK